MAIDLNGSATGLNYATSYQEENAAIGIVASGVKVGSGSSTANTDGIITIRVQMYGVAPGDQWQLSALPPNFVFRTGGSQLVSVPATLDASQVLYIDALSGATDAAWQSALQAIKYCTSETASGTRDISIQASNSPGVYQPAVTTHIDVTAFNDAPVANPDVANATEAGGVNNTSAGSNPTGSVLTNDTDNDVGDQRSVVSVTSATGTATAGQALQGNYGTLVLNSNGGYTYNVNQSQAAVQALRTTQDTLSDVFTYPSLYLGLGSASGVSLGAMLNAVYSAALYGVGLAVLAPTWPNWLALMLAGQTDFTAILAAASDWSNYSALDDQGRTVEADVAFSQFWRNVVKAIPLANSFSGMIGAHDLAVGTPTNLTQAQYEQAVRERVAALENDATHTRPSEQALALATSLGSQGQFFLVQGLVDDFPYQINNGIRVIKSVMVNEVSQGVASTQAGLHFYGAGVDITGAEHMGPDVVNFSFAQASVGIHTGVSYNGLTAYDGIGHFIGSEQKDLFTRYSATRSDATVVIDTGSTSQSDTIDLRGGNNLVLLGNGSVHLNDSGLDSARDTGQLLWPGLDLDAERLAGPWKNDATGYGQQFSNTFDANNHNVINVVASQAPDAWVEVQGSAQAQDTLAFSLLDSGIDLRFDATGGASGTHLVPANSYRFSLYSEGAASTELGHADNAIDTLIGSAHSDHIVVAGAAAIRQIMGNGGDDFIDVNRSGVSIETLDGRSNVELGDNATATQVFAGVGTQVQITTQLATTAANDEVTVAIDHRLPGVAPESDTTLVRAFSSTVNLHVRADAGQLKVELGSGDATVEIGENVRGVTIQDVTPDVGHLRLLFRNADDSFDRFADLHALDGTDGKLTLASTGVYQGVWTTASGHAVDITLVANAASLHDIELGGAFAQESTYSRLDQLVA